MAGHLVCVNCSIAFLPDRAGVGVVRLHIARRLNHAFINKILSHDIVMAWILQVTVLSDSNLCSCCAIEILQIFSINLVLFAWFWLVWYILQSASCTPSRSKPGNLFGNLFLEWAGKPFTPKHWGTGVYLSLGSGWDEARW